MPSGVVQIFQVCFTQASQRENVLASSLKTILIAKERFLRHLRDLFGPCAGHGRWLHPRHNKHELQKEYGSIRFKNCGPPGFLPLKVYAHVQQETLLDLFAAFLVELATICCSLVLLVPNSLATPVVFFSGGFSKLQVHKAARGVLISRSSGPEAPGATRWADALWPWDLR